MHNLLPRKMISGQEEPKYRIDSSNIIRMSADTIVKLHNYKNKLLGRTTSLYEESKNEETN